jgi:hypothetical protein
MGSQIESSGHQAQGVLWLATLSWSLSIRIDNWISRSLHNWRAQGQDRFGCWVTVAREAWWINLLHTISSEGFELEERIYYLWPTPKAETFSQLTAKPEVISHQKREPTSSTCRDIVTRIFLIKEPPASKSASEQASSLNPRTCGRSFTAPRGDGFKIRSIGRSDKNPCGISALNNESHAQLPLYLLGSLCW